MERPQATQREIERQSKRKVDGRATQQAYCSYPFVKPSQNAEDMQSEWMSGNKGNCPVGICPFVCRIWVSRSLQHQRQGFKSPGINVNEMWPKI